AGPAARSQGRAGGARGPRRVAAVAAEWDTAHSAVHPAEDRTDRRPSAVRPAEGRTGHPAAGPAAEGRTGHPVGPAPAGAECDRGPKDSSSPSSPE
ncbi:hypothetical protein E1285_41050, partial [Actinomadura sp. 7K507]